MQCETLYAVQGLYRDDFRITGFSFGEGEKALCIVGSMRGNENQQLYCCARLVSRLRFLEEQGRLAPGHRILVIPSVNPYSMNIHKRFWPIDNTDINRMFPGYDQGETTQRIAAAVFQVIREYRFGIQFASFYMPGSFMPHVRMMKTGYENVELARQFGFPYVVLHQPRPFDTATLNYNWQIWETQAFSLYTTNTARVDKNSARQAEEAVLHFMSCQGLLTYRGSGGYVSSVIDSTALLTLRAEHSGFLDVRTAASEHVEKGQLLAQILDTYTGDVLQELRAPCQARVFFVGDEAMTFERTAVFKLIEEDAQYGF